VLRRLDEPVDLIVADPPYGLGVGRGCAEDVGERVYGRAHGSVVPGYVDVDPGEYAEFTGRWVAAATAALRPGGYLAAITGPQQAARVQVTAEDAGLTYVNQVVSRRPFPLRTTRRFAHAHLAITIMCSGPLRNPLRRFTPPADLPLAHSGVDYPTDWWWDVPQPRRPGLLRYANALPPRLVRRLVLALTAEQELVADPFLGSGTTAVVCLLEGRRFIGGDVNPEALRFTMARVLEEVLTPLADPEPMEMAAAAGENQ
jgi:DNA modification methylase